MKFIKLLFFISFLTFFSCDRSDRSVLSVPAYKLIHEFSGKMKDETGLVMFRYGVNNNLPKSYNIKNGLVDFNIGYYLFKDKNETISIEYARDLIVFVTERFLSEINKNEKIRENLDFFPFTNDLINISIYFVDKNKIELGNGVAYAFIINNKITYQRYDIEEYREIYPSIGKHHVIHQESYEDALRIVKSNDGLSHFEKKSCL